MQLIHYWRAMWGIIGRELWRFVTQRERFISALVRPLVWLFVFAAGFRAALGLAITPPYETYILYEVYITPGLLGMIQLFNGMQSSLSMVYDREMGSMRILLVSPLPRWFLLLSKLIAGVCVSIVQVYVFLAIAWCYDIHAPLQGYVWLLPTLLLSGLMLGALGLLLSSLIKQLEKEIENNKRQARACINSKVKICSVEIDDSISETSRTSEKNEIIEDSDNSE